MAYALARENEIKTVRIILSGKLNGLSDDSIRERVREMYGGFRIMADDFILCRPACLVNGVKSRPVHNHIAELTVPCMKQCLEGFSVKPTKTAFSFCRKRAGEIRILQWTQRRY